MRRTAIVPAIVLGLSSFASAAPAQATGGVPGLDTCGQFPDVQICSGEVTSWDGSPLDVDLTLPKSGVGDRHPLIVMLHGFGNNKHEWESTTDEGDNADKWRWNNHWFAEHGFYVLTYTARGFLDLGRDSKRTDQPDTPAGHSPCSLPPDEPGSYCQPFGTIHLKSRDYEIKDTQWLAAEVAKAFPDVDANAVAVTGGSYGGGESWMQASQPVWDAFSATHPELPVLHLQVAVPKYPWTDLGYSLAPNGHKGPFDGTIYSSSSGSPTSDTGDGNPVGVIKDSYATGFFFQGLAQGFFETTPENLPGWFNDAVVVGDPYDAGSAGTDRPVYIKELRRGLTELRGAFYQDEFWAPQVAKREVAIFSVSGWTDDLFPPVEAFRQFKYLKSLDRLWPVEVAVADVGHPRAQNPAFEWHPLNDRAWGFLKEQINGSHRQQTTVLTMPTICPPAGDETGLVQHLTGRTPEELASGTLTVQYASPGRLRNTKATPTEDPDNLQTDPVTGFLAGAPGCRASVAPRLVDETARYTAYSAPLDRPRVYIGLGEVQLTYTLIGANTATLLARVWDVAPDGTAFLMTRGAYRIDGNLGPPPAGFDSLPSGTLDLPLFGNHWMLAAGHRMRLDLTQVDFPTFLPGNSMDALIAFPSADLVLPTREATTLTLPGA